MRIAYFLCFWCAGECTGELDDEQVQFMMWDASLDQMDQEQERLLVLGIKDSAIKKIQNHFPRLSITSLDSPLYSHSFDRRQGRQVMWADQYDKIIVYLALEKDPYREQKLRALYRALKSGKDGIIICIRKDSPSIDRWVERFAENTGLAPFISNTPNLSPEEYRTLIQSTGFDVSHEYPSGSILTNIYNITEWICTRWAVPLAMHSHFMVDFPRFMDGVLSRHDIIYSELCIFKIRK